MAYMDHEKFWPNVWFVGERGDVDLIDMYDALHSEENCEGVTDTDRQSTDH